jgi:hypothetical protein
MEMELASSKAERSSDSIIRQFHPIVAGFGFTKPEWDYDPELDTVRVQFKNPDRGIAVQVDCHFRDGSYSANYCRMDGAWQMCIEGKRKSLPALRKTLSRWISKHCVECRERSEPEKETELELPTRH